MKKGVALPLLLSLFLGPPVAATTLLWMDVTDLTWHSTDVVIGRVVSQETLAGRPGVPLNRLRVEITRTLKGNLRGEVVVENPGFAGAPVFLDGDEVVLFLCSRAGRHDLVGGEPRMVVGTYSYRQDGRLGLFTIPGLPPGEYGIWVEPMDGSPVAALQTNSRIQFTVDTHFPEDWYSGHSESGAEPAPGDPGSAVPVRVEAGGLTRGIFILIEESVPGWCMNAGAAFRGGAAVAALEVGLLLSPLLLLAALRRSVRRRAGIRTRRE